MLTLSRVIERDGVCVCCESVIDLEAHHIRPFATFEQDRYKLWNGITFCKECHEETHNK